MAGIDPCWGLWPAHRPSPCSRSQWRALDGHHTCPSNLCLPLLCSEALECGGPRIRSLFQLGHQRLSEIKGQSLEPGVIPEHGASPGKFPSCPTTANDPVPKATYISCSFTHYSRHIRSQGAGCGPHSRPRGKLLVKPHKGWPSHLPRLLALPSWPPPPSQALFQPRVWLGCTHSTSKLSRSLAEPTSKESLVHSPTGKL